MLEQTERRLQRLRMLYEQYFQGLERLEPLNQKRDLDSTISVLRRNQPNNTAMRFKFSQVVQRYTTYNTYWRRITRQIEEGTYKRDVLRARRIAEQPKEADPDAPERPDSYELDMDLDVDAALEAVLKKSEPPAEPAATKPNGKSKEITPFAHPSDKPPLRSGPGPVKSFPPPAGARPRGAPPPVPPKAAGASGKRPAPPPVPGGKRPPPPPPGGGGGMSDAQIRQIHERYVAARRKNNERVDNVKAEQIAKSVQAMMPKLQKKHVGKKIDFEVVLRNGKVALKPVAK